jgi:hypothetical protein
VTGDESTENEGKFDQAKSSIKDADEKVKDPSAIICRIVRVVTAMYSAASATDA